MRRLLRYLVRFVVLLTGISVALLILFLAVLDFSVLASVFLTVALAGIVAPVALTLTFVPDELEAGLQQSIDDQGRRSLLDEIKRQGPGPRRKNGEAGP